MTILDISIIMILIQNKEKKEKENNMNPSMANDIINSFAIREGFPTIKELHLMEHADFLRELELWPTDYIEALPDAGLHYKLDNKIQHPRTGQMVRSEWGWKMEQVHKAIEFRNSTEGKKHVLRFQIPEPVRNEETDINDMLNTASIKVSATNVTEKKKKKQTQLNIARMEHVKALEKSISKGGGLRTMYDVSLKTYIEDVDNLMTNEDAAKAAMKSKRRKRIPALLLSWLVMPLYVIFRSFDMLFDGFFTSMKLGYTEVGLGPKVGSNHPFLGRLSIPLVVATFISFIDAFAKYNAGAEKYVEHGPFVSGLIMIPVYAIGFAIVKQFLDIPFMWLTNIYGRFATRASYMFEPTAAEEYQLSGVTNSYEQQGVLGQLIKEREELINDLKNAIENDLPYSRCDTYRSDKRFSLKTIERENRDNYGYEY